MPAMSDDDSELLKKANIKISDLKEDIPWLSDELQRKDSLLSSFMVAKQSQKSALLSAAP